MARRKKPRLNGILSLEEVQAMVGKTFLVRVEDLEVYFPVEVLSVGLIGCNLRARVRPVGGMEECEICCGDLLTPEQVHLKISDDVVASQIERATREIMGQYYIRDRRAAFLAVVEAECSEEEKAKLEEEANNDWPRKGLNFVSDSFMRNHLETFLTRKYKERTALS